jgi:hypothetical protein
MQVRLCLRSLLLLPVIRTSKTRGRLPARLDPPLTASQALRKPAARCVHGPCRSRYAVCRGSRHGSWLVGQALSEILYVLRQLPPTTTTRGGYALRAVFAFLLFFFFWREGVVIYVLCHFIPSCDQYTATSSIQDVNHLWCARGGGRAPPRTELAALRSGVPTFSGLRE